MPPSARKDPPPRATFRCVEPFAVYGADGVPSVYANGSEVLDDDPILKTHRPHFEPASARALHRTRVEQTTAEPGMSRNVVPVSPVVEDKS